MLRQSSDRTTSLPDDGEGRTMTTTLPVRLTKARCFDSVESEKDLFE